MKQYERETIKLLEILQKHGLEPTQAHYSGDSSDLFKPTYEEMSNVEDACLYVKHADGETWLRLIYGNGPGELVSDWGIPKSEQFNAAIDAATQEFYDEFN